MTLKNRRSQNRYPLHLKFSATFGERAISGFSGDISAGALFLPCAAPLKKGESARLQIFLPGTGEKIEAFGKVTRVSGGAPGRAPGAAVRLERLASGAEAFAAFFAGMPAAARKDRDPRETISFALRQLRGIGIRPRVVSRRSVGRNFHSLRLADARLPMGVNGKGLTPDFAMASAFGEFMERVQNKTLLPGTFGLMPGKPFLQSTETRTFAELMREQPGVMKALLDFPLPQKGGIAPGKKLDCMPFFSVNDRSVAYLPYAYIARACGSSGMCAGNTPEEAIAQGLGEILERYVMRRIICTPGTPVPTIPLSLVKSPKLLAKIRNLETRGFRITIKDCTLGGRFPVLGTILSSERRQTYLANFGAAPTFDVALERCLTEAFQGEKDPVFPIDFASPEGPKERYYEFYASCRNGTGRMPPAMFLPGGKPAFGTAFLEVFQSNRNALKHMLDCLRMNGGKVFVHDCSHLGFPAYRLYVPGFSELAKWNREMRLDHEETRDLLKRTLLRLKSETGAKVGAAAEALENLFKSPKFAFESANSLPALIIDTCGVKFKNPNDMAGELCASGEKLLALLFHRSGNAAKASGYLKAHLDAHPEDASPYMSGCLAYMTLSAEGLGPRPRLAAMESFFGAELAAEIAADMDSPEKIFQYYSLPDCGKCSACEIKKSCLYEAWKEVMTAFRKQIKKAAVSQERLAEVFSGL